jgi:hypothetical protein
LGEFATWHQRRRPAIFIAVLEAENMQKGWFFIENRKIKTENRITAAAVCL